MKFRFFSKAVSEMTFCRYPTSLWSRSLNKNFPTSLFLTREEWRTSNLNNSAQLVFSVPLLSERDSVLGDLVFDIQVAAQLAAGDVVRGRSLELNFLVLASLRRRIDFQEAEVWKMNRLFYLQFEIIEKIVIFNYLFVFFSKIMLKNSLRICQCHDFSAWKVYKEKAFSLLLPHPYTFSKLTNILILCNGCAEILILFRKTSSIIHQILY